MSVLEELQSHYRQVRQRLEYPAMRVQDTAPDPVVKAVDVVEAPTVAVVKPVDEPIIVIKYPSVIEIQIAVCSKFAMHRLDLLSPRREIRYTRPRQIAMWLCRRLTPRTYPEIGRHFGGRDHTTVIHAVQRINELMESDAELAADVAELTKLLSREDQE